MSHINIVRIKVVNNALGDLRDKIHHSTIENLLNNS